MSNDKTYYDWLFTETEKEKDLHEKIKEEREAFKRTEAYKEHQKRLDGLFDELEKEGRKRREEAKKHRPSRGLPKKKPKEEIENFKKDQIAKAKERLAAYPEKLRALIEGYEKLGKAEKKIFNHETLTRFEEYPDYENPQTTENDLRELLEILVQEIIDFINERGLKDIECLYFGADCLQSSAKYGEWTPATDANIYALGMQKEKQEDGKEYLVYKKVGNYM